jgi:homoaconitase
VGLFFFVTFPVLLNSKFYSFCTQKQGILPLWFINKEDYSRIRSGDVLETMGLANLLQGQGQGNSDAQIVIKVTPRDGGEVFEIPTRHTMSVDQLKWLRAGSALNYIREEMKAKQK